MIARASLSVCSFVVRLCLLAAFVAFTAGPVPANAQERGYGYYEVVGAESLNIRRRPSLSSEVLTVAPRGATLVKWKRFCSLRPWCPVQYGDLQGWAGKAFLVETDGD